MELKAPIPAKPPGSPAAWCRRPTTAVVLALLSLSAGFSTLAAATDPQPPPIQPPPSAAKAPTRPKLELGAGFGSQILADYRGSDYYQANVLPIPYVVYRGEFLELDRSGARGKLIRSDRAELVVSGDVALTRDSDDNPLRQGMPELQPTFELGPSLNLALDQSLDRGWSLRLPIRAVFAFDGLEVEPAGHLFNPELQYSDPAFRQHYRLRYSIGALFADQQYHELYYGVDPDYARAGRPPYRAKSGYSGIRLKAGISRHFDRWWLGAYLRYENLAGTENRDSPLVETEHYFSFGLAICRVFWHFGSVPASRPGDDSEDLL